MNGINNNQKQKEQVELSEIILLDKPAGITSAELLRRYKREHPEVKKIGHAGTLDPFATGLIVVGINKGTKRLSEFLGADKEYIAEIMLGRKTDTADTEGKILTEKNVFLRKIREKGGILIKIVSFFWFLKFTKKKFISEKRIRKMVKSLLGKNILQVPLYSAVRVDGRHLYWYARRGKTPSRIPKREMEVKEAELLSILENGQGKVIIKVRFLVSSGVYIRTLGEELGRRLALPAMLVSLRRIKVGDFKVSTPTTNY